MLENNFEILFGNGNQLKNLSSESQNMLLRSRDVIPIDSDIFTIIDVCGGDDYSATSVDKRKKNSVEQESVERDTVKCDPETNPETNTESEFVKHKSDNKPVKRKPVKRKSVKRRSDSTSPNASVNALPYPITPLAQYLTVIIPDVIPFHITSIQSASDNYVKQFVKTLIIKRIITNEPFIMSILHPTQDILISKSNNTIFSLSDIIPTSTIQQYGYIGIPLSNSIRVLETPSISTTLSRNIMTFMNSILFVHPLSKELFNKLFTHITQYRKSYIQLLDNVQKLLQKQEIDYEILVLLVDRIIYLRHLLE